MAAESAIGMHVRTAMRIS